jgi:hypothetical protein
MVLSHANGVMSASKDDSAWKVALPACCVEAKSEDERPFRRR